MSQKGEYIDTPDLQAEIDFWQIELNSTDQVLKEAKALYQEWAKT